MESGLVGLRAELHKKRTEANKFGTRQKGPPKRDGVKQDKKTVVFNRSNAGVAIRAARDKQQWEDELITQEKARSILEEKAAMYDRLHGGVEALDSDSLNQKYLVNFQKKITDEVMDRKEKAHKEETWRNEQNERETANPEYYKPSREDEEWVEYTDVLGRTRECMKKDLPSMLEKDKELTRDTEEDDASLDPELLSEDMRREIQRQKWEAMEEVNKLKKDIHYQDVMFDEARVHGVGYMRFARDDKKRKEQLDLLKELHTEAQQGEKAKSIAAAKKQKMLQSRLEKVRQKKRLKMGLPILGDNKLKTPPASEDEDDCSDFNPVPPVLGAAVNEQHIEAEAEPKKKRQVREWDFGKVGVKSTFSQEEWVDRQRDKRNSEFAPPSYYDTNKSKKFNNFNCKYHEEASSSSSTTSDNLSGSGNVYQEAQTVFGQSCSYSDTAAPYGSDEESGKWNPDFAPPATYDYYGPSSLRGRSHYKKPQYKSMEEAVSKGLENLRKMSGK